MICTGNFFSAALILPSTNSQYDKEKFHGITSSVHENTSVEHGQNVCITCSAHVLHL